MNARQAEKEKPPTKTMSVRLPIEEAELVKTTAKKAGLNVNDYIRQKVTKGTGLLNMDDLDSAIEEMTQLQRLLELHIETLDALAAKVEQEGLTPETEAALEREMKEIERLCEELTRVYEKVLDISTTFLLDYS